MLKDQIGKVYGTLKILKKYSERRGKYLSQRAYCECVICGATGEVSFNDLRQKNTTTCRNFENKKTDKGSYFEVYTHSGVILLIDKEDYFLIEGHSICSKEGNYILCGALKKEYKTRYLHKVIIMNIYGRDIEYGDHKNNDPRDCRRENLRPADACQNARNCLIPKIKNKVSKYKGVSFHAQHKKWFARITVNRKRINLGEKETEIEAALLYDEASIKYHNEFAKTNKMLGLL